jgi:hypothetical protein
MPYCGRTPEVPGWPKTEGLTQAIDAAVAAVMAHDWAADLASVTRDIIYI